ncbi:MAG: hypothetical protein ACPGYK_06515 [Flavobacteriales bacterium]
MRTNWIAFALPLLAWMGCQKEQALMEPVLVETIDLNSVYGTRTGMAPLGPDYRYQAYYSLVDNELVATHDKYDWEVALTHEDNPKLVINSAIPGLRIAYGSEDWTEWTDEFDLTWLYDLPTGQASDLAIGLNWANQTLVMDRGLDPLGEHRGFKKFRVERIQDSLIVQSASLSGENESIFAAIIDSAYYQTEWHLDNGVKRCAPPKNSWDLLLSNYLHVYDPLTDPFPYQVTGVLLNPHDRMGAKFEAVTWDEFESNAQEVTPLLVPELDVIGFEWKYYDFELGYIINEDDTFVVRCGDQGTFVLSFTGFHNDMGEPGYPQFVFRRLPD